VPGGLVGSRAEEARRTLEVMGLEVQTVQVRSREAKGIVLATVPRAGRVLERGDTVVLVVSRGGKVAEGRQREEAFTVPGWIVGRPLERVRDELPDDLRVTTVRVSSTRDEDTVVATWPGADATLPDGQLVLFVSAGQDD
jgi:beta-lactam-binding protein with PASTA domain